jgi:hypothetical protein
LGTQYSEPRDGKPPQPSAVIGKRSIVNLKS